MRYFAGMVLSLAVVFAPITQAQEQAPHEIVVAVQTASADYLATGTIEPLIFDLINELQVDLRFYVCPWARCLRALENGDADAMFDLYHSTEREAYIHFIQPPYRIQTNTFRFYTRKNSRVSIDSWQDLTQHSIGTVRSNLYFPRFDQASNITKVATRHISHTIEMLKIGRIDAIIIPPSMLDSHVREYDSGGELQQQPFEVSYEQGVYLGVAHKSPWMQHLDKLTRALVTVAGANPSSRSGEVGGR